MPSRLEVVVIVKPLENDVQLIKVDLDLLDGFGDLFNALFLVVFRLAVHRQFVAILLDHLAAVSNFVESQSSRRTLEEMAKARELVEISRVPTRRDDQQGLDNTIRVTVL